jgi:hypothetical protein
VLQALLKNSLIMILRFCAKSRFGFGEKKYKVARHGSHIFAQTALTIIAFFRILVLYPEVQKRAQKELDAVTGGLRLPDYNDRPRLPYIYALCREVMRWSMATPVG